MDDLIPRPTLASLVEHHNQAVALMRQGLESLAKAQRIMLGTLGQHARIFEGSSFHTYYLRDPEFVARLADDTQSHIRGCFWDFTQRQAGLRDIMCKEDRASLDNQIKNHTTPPFTLPNLITTLNGLALDAEEIFLRAVRACYDHYRPRDHNRKHVTNKTDRIGPKVIKASCIGSFSINIYSEDYLADLCRVFHGLDGRTAAQRDKTSNLVTAISTALRNKRRGCQTPYFNCKWYKNGNLHITFTRPDLLARFNQLGAVDNNKNLGCRIRTREKNHG